MTPFYADDWLTLYGGDCRTVLASLPADSVDCVVTSPPYWGLRDYGTAAWIGGNEGHEHRGTTVRTAPAGSEKQASKRGSTDVYSGDCSCGSQRVDSHLGLECTPAEYVSSMVAVFAEVRRVLKPSGTCWLNLGDSYGGDKGGDTRSGFNARYHGKEYATDKQGDTARQLPNRSVLKPKDLVGIPWRVAFALQADGWYLRSDIIWSKPNPMPESVTDRPTKAHEYLFLLTKSARYYFDAAAIAEPVAESTVRRLAQPTLDEQPGSSRIPGKTNGPMKAVPPRFGGAKYGNDGSDHHRTKSGNAYTLTDKRNARSVWTIATQPYVDAHFAVFPPALPERCIKAGSPEGGLILDPFAGTGTVGMVANRLSRRAILIDLNPEYLVQQMKRNAQTPLGLVSGPSD